MKVGTVESLIGSYCAVTFMVLFVTYEQHFEVTWSDPATYTAPLHHKCGCTLLMCLVWAVLETILFASATLRERREERARTARLAALRAADKPRPWREARAAGLRQWSRERLAALRPMPRSVPAA